MFKLTRHKDNPIFSPSPLHPFEKEGVLNPGVVLTPEGVVMLYRAVGEKQNYISRIGLATSTDGINFERSVQNPVFSPKEDFDMWGAEDPRITKIGDDYFVAYVAVPDPVLIDGHAVERKKPLETAAALLKTRDFKNFENLGVVTPVSSDNKDVVLFPRKINGRYAMLHRPNHWNREWCKTPFEKTPEDNLLCAMSDLPEAPGIWIAWSDDLIHWDDHKLIMSTYKSFDAKIGAGLPPIETRDGWLIIYHHVEKAGAGRLIYSTRAALLSLKDPRRLLSDLPWSILEPETPYEKNIVFPSGGFVKDDTLYVYYGASDASIGLATGSVSELLSDLRAHI